VQSFTGSTYKVDFPEVKGWTGDERDLTISNGLDRSTTDIGIVDLNFNKFGFVRNKGEAKFEFTGAGLQVGGRGLWEYGFVQASKKLTQSCFYFEVTIQHRSDASPSKLEVQRGALATIRACRAAAAAAVSQHIGAWRCHGPPHSCCCCFLPVRASPLLPQSLCCATFRACVITQ
jgi:hypothetical protein